MQIKVKFYKQANTNTLTNLGTMPWCLTCCELQEVTDEDDVSNIVLELPTRIAVSPTETTMYSIYNSAFYGNDWLKEIHFKGYIDAIGAGAFARSSIAAIYFHSLIPPKTFARSAFEGIEHSDFTIYVPLGAKYTYYCTETLMAALGGRAQWERIVQEGDYVAIATNDIPPLYLYGNQHVSDIIIENQSSIGQMAFMGVKSAEGVGPDISIAPENEYIVTVDGDLRFNNKLYYLDSAKTISNTGALPVALMPNSLYKNSAIISDDQVLELHIPKISALAFQDMVPNQNLHLIIGPEVQEISSCAFEGLHFKTIAFSAPSQYFDILGTQADTSVQLLCTKNTHLPIVAAYNKDEDAVINGAKLKTDILSHITYIPSNMFKDIRISGPLEIPRNIHYIGRNAFYNMQIVADTDQDHMIILYAPNDAVMTIESGAFQNIHGLKQVYCIGENITFGKSSISTAGSDTAAPNAIDTFVFTIGPVNAHRRSGGARKGIIPIATTSMLKTSNVDNLMSYVSNIMILGDDENKTIEQQYKADKQWALYFNEASKYIPPELSSFVFLYNPNERSQTLIEYTGTDQTLTFPASALYYSKMYIGNGSNVFNSSSTVQYLDLTEVPNALVGVGANAFQNSKLIAFEAPGSLKTIGACAFYKAGALQTFDLSAVSAMNEKSTTETNKNQYTGTVIPEYCCYQCENLVSVKLPEDTVQLDDHCFESCKRLHTLTIPASVKRIEGHCFSFGGDMQNAIFGSPFDPTVITMQSTIPPAIADTAFKYANFLKIRVPRNTLSTYKTSSNWVVLSRRIEIVSTTTDEEKQYCINNKKQTIEWEEYDL